MSRDAGREAPGAAAAVDPACRPIGVFDSGIGGLTLVKALLAEAPGVSVVYFGDTARLPYGTKSDATITRQSLECIRFLTGFDVRLLVVACNTASSIALPALARAVDRPLIGVIEAAVDSALARTRNNRIGLIGTAATVRSGGYERRLRERRQGLHLVSRACPLFVPLVEEGWTDHAVTRLVAREYLEPLLAEGIDTLILGCTHYPLLKRVLEETAGPDVVLIDTGAETAHEVVRRLGELGGTAPQAGCPPEHRFFVSDVPARFEANGERFLGRSLGPVTLVEQSDSPWYERIPGRTPGPPTKETP